MIITSLVPVEAGNRESLLGALREVGQIDSDFNGDNGELYHWEETLDGKFESNLEYLIDRVKDIEKDEDCVNTFIEEWMERDRNYYDEYFVQCLTDSEDRVTVISFVAIHND